MSLVAAYRRLLSNPALARLLAGEFVSSVGDWLHLVALIVLVYRQTEDPLVLGIVGAARVLPYVLLSVPAGIIADRYDRRLVLLVTDVARGVLMIGLTWLVATDGPIAAIVGLAIAATCFSAFFGPTIGAYLPTLVRDEEELGPANSAWAGLDNLAFIVGPAIAGVLIAAGGLSFAFALNAVSFGIIALVLWGLPQAARPGEEPGSVPPVVEADAGDPDPATPDPRGGALGGLSFRPVAGLALLEVVGSFVFGGLAILTVILAARELGGDDATGYLNAAIGAGGLIGAVASAALVLRRRLGPPLIVGGIGLAAGLAALGATRSLGPALIAMAIASAGSLIVEVVGTTIFQRVVPDRIRGRALGVVATLSTLAYAMGSLFFPILHDAIGTTTLLAGSSVLVAVSVGAAIVVVGRAADRAPDPLDPARARVARLPIFAGIPADRLDAAVRRLDPRSVRVGETVIRQGDPADRFYVIVEGRFAALDARAGGRLLREMGPDDVFGEIGLLTGAPRTATVRAETDGLLLALDGPTFLELAWSGPSLASRLLNVHLGTNRDREPTATVSGMRQETGPPAAGAPGPRE